MLSGGTHNSTKTEIRIVIFGLDKFATSLS